MLTSVVPERCKDRSDCQATSGKYQAQGALSVDSRLFLPYGILTLLLELIQKKAMIGSFAPEIQALQEIDAKSRQEITSLRERVVELEGAAYVQLATSQDRFGRSVY